MSLRVLNDNILIEPDPYEPTDSNPEVVRILKEGLIQLPDEYKNALIKVSPKGTIVSWGDKCRYSHKVGDRVYFRQFGGTNLIHEDKTYKVVNEWDLLGSMNAE